jgi:fumarate hydratase subunit beta
MVKVETPVSDALITRLKVGDRIEIFGTILLGRDAVLPVLRRRIEEGVVDELICKLRGSIVMHAGFSVAGFGPTTSGKEAIQGSMPALARAGVKIHLGKGSLKEDTIESLNEFNSIFAVTPPVTALMMKAVKSVRVVGFEHEGMEALHEVTVDGLQAIVSIAHGRSIFERRVNASD